MHSSQGRRFVTATGMGLAVLMAALPGAQQTLARSTGADVNLTLVAYSTPKSAYDRITAAFARTPAGKNVHFSASYGASGDQSQLVANGLHADIVAFSLTPDITRLVKAKLVKANWYQNAYHGFVTQSTVVFGVRRGNPKHIHTWADLLKPGVEVINPNPFTSGGARWNVMAAYGAQRKQGKTDKQSIAYLQQLYNHITVQDKSARDELATFLSGKGDVMLGYENELIAAQVAGNPIQYVVPSQSILIENPVAVTTETNSPGAANAFVSFLYTKTAQKLYAGEGFWPVRADVRKTTHFARPHTLFTIRDFGSWPAVMVKFFDPHSGVMASIEQRKGGAP